MSSRTRRRGRHPARTYDPKQDGRGTIALMALLLSGMVISIGAPLSGPAQVVDRIALWILAIPFGVALLLLERRYLGAIASGPAPISYLRVMVALGGFMAIGSEVPVEKRRRRR